MPRDKPAINVANGNIVNFNACNATSDSFKIKKKTNQTGNNQTKQCWMILLKYISNFWKTL